MGKQVRFYMTADDEAAFLDGIRKTGDVALIPWRSAGPVLTPMESLPDPAAPFAYHVCLWNRDVSPPPVRRDVPDTEDQTVDKLVSEVIEWDRSLLREGVLHSGRIWAEFRCWDRGSDPPVLTTKGPAFSKWYDQLARLLRSRGKRNADGDYLWPGSQAFAASGGVLR